MVWGYGTPAQYDAQRKLPETSLNDINIALPNINTPLSEQLISHIHIKFVISQSCFFIAKINTYSCVLMR